jgi:hypothetical protein
VVNDIPYYVSSFERAGFGSERLTVWVLDRATG